MPIGDTQSKVQMKQQKWEDSELPILCETCLGDNPYVRMVRQTYGKTCKTCDKPYTSFRWRAGTDGRFKSTQVCQSCAKAKNVCQCCILDLTYGLPVQVRDSFLNVNEASDVPQSGANRDFYLQSLENKAQSGENQYGKARINQQLLSLTRKSPYSERNLPHICSFYARGCCTRGAACPYRHVKPNDPEDPLNKQNIRDRYDGKNDPVAQKILSRFKKQQEEAEKQLKKEEEEDSKVPKVY